MFSSILTNLNRLDMFDQDFNEWDDFEKVDSTIYSTGTAIAPVESLPGINGINGITGMSNMNNAHSNLSASFCSNLSNSFPTHLPSNLSGEVDGYKYHDVPYNYQGNNYSDAVTMNHAVPPSHSSNIPAHANAGYDFDFVPELLPYSINEFSTLGLPTNVVEQPYQNNVMKYNSVNLSHDATNYDLQQLSINPSQNNLIKLENQNQFIPNQDSDNSPYNINHLSSGSYASESTPFSSDTINHNNNNAAANNTSLGIKRYRVVRGVSAGGCTTRPPKHSVDSDSMFLLTELNLVGANVEDICYPMWSPAEKEDRRRIIRIERIQQGPKLIANFSIVGSANESPITVQPPPGVDVVEVSCLECTVRNDDYDSQSSDDEFKSPLVNNNSSYIKTENGECYQYYITSVEVIEIVELLIGNQTKDPAERRRERGRVRSNLVPFWSKKPISSRMNDTTAIENKHNHNNDHLPTNQDYRLELAKRIMGYEIRKPRGFDKEVRILRWDKLVPALRRALQSYYTEIPQSDVHLEFN